MFYINLMIVGSKIVVCFCCCAFTLVLTLLSWPFSIYSSAGAVMAYLFSFLFFNPSCVWGVHHLLDISLCLSFYKIQWPLIFIFIVLIFFNTFCLCQCWNLMCTVQFEKMLLQCSYSNAFWILIFYCCCINVYFRLLVQPKYGENIRWISTPTSSTVSTSKHEPRIGWSSPASRTISHSQIFYDQ